MNSNNKTDNYNAILFDLDGTITNPEVGITNSIIYALKKFGIKEDNRDKLLQFIGPPLLDSFKKHYSFSDTDGRRAVDCYREYYTDKGIFEAELYEGITELLDQLSDKKRQLVLATSKPTIYAAKILKYFKLGKYFYFVGGSKLDCTRTDKTEVVDFALSKLTALQKDATVMVGDRPEDIIGAHKNNIHSIAVTYGFGSAAEFQDVKPTHIVDTIEDLKVLLTKGRE